MCVCVLAASKDWLSWISRRVKAHGHRISCYIYNWRLEYPHRFTWICHDQWHVRFAGMPSLQIFCSVEGFLWCKPRLCFIEEVIPSFVVQSFKNLFNVHFQEVCICPCVCPHQHLLPCLMCISLCFLHTAAMCFSLCLPSHLCASLSVGCTK